MSDQQEPIPFTGAEVPFVIYAKHWYGRSRNIVQDLRRVLATYSSIDLQFVHERDVLAILCGAVAKIHNRHFIQEALIEMVGKKWEGFNDSFQRAPEQVMVGQLSVSDPEKNPFPFDENDLLLPRGFFNDIEYKEDGSAWVKEKADHSKCGASTAISEAPSFGRGECDEYGFWEIPCYHCARRFEKEYPEHGDCWPHTKEQLSEETC